MDQMIGVLSVARGVAARYSLERPVDRQTGRTGRSILFQAFIQRQTVSRAADVPMRVSRGEGGTCSSRTLSFSEVFRSISSWMGRGVGGGWEARSIMPARSRSLAIIWQRRKSVG